MSRTIRCKYDIVGLEPSNSPGPDALLQRAQSLGVEWMKIDRVKHAAHFRPATYGIQGNSDPFRRCQPDLWAPRAWILHGASSGWSVSLDTQSGGLGSLQA